MTSSDPVQTAALKLYTEMTYPVQDRAVENHTMSSGQPGADHIKKYPPPRRGNKTTCCSLTVFLSSIVISFIIFIVLL